MQEELDIRKIQFGYYQGGLGGGTSTSGNASIVNFRLNPHLRIGKNFFVKIGVFYAHSISSRITTGKSYSWSMCPISAPGTPPPYCPPPITKSIANLNSPFAKNDMGTSLGIGYTWHGWTLAIDYYNGFLQVINDRHQNGQTKQFNASLILPLKIPKNQL
jgi:hypothetical protein